MVRSGTGDIHVNLPGIAARDRRTGEANLVIHQMVLRPGEITTVKDPRHRPRPHRGRCGPAVGRLHAVALDSSLNRRILVPEDRPGTSVDGWAAGEADAAVV
jgi:hypothetical protein